jgi:malate/lactate dehydrogenase
MSVPCVVDRGGIAAHLDVPMDDAEHDALAASATAIRQACATVGA